MEEKNNKDEDYDGPDLTKDAFFSDMEDIEEEIASEAYSIVEHALSLIQSGYYDDAIEVIRQGIGLYEQINKQAEIDALKSKIADVYILKEQAFKRLGSKEVEDTTSVKSEPIASEGEKEISTNISNLLSKATELIESDQFDAALDNYDNAIELSQKINDENKIREINNLIEICYNKKAEYLREKRKQEELMTENKLTPEQLKAKKLKKFEEAKLREETISNQAFEKIGNASDLAKIHQYDKAIALYLEGASLLQQIGWSNESKKIHNTISYLEKQKESHLQEIEEIKAIEREKQITDQQKELELVERAVIKEVKPDKSQAKKIAQLNAKKEAEENFKKQISEMVETAEKIAKEYDIEMKKAIKQGNLIDECVYPKIIKIYEDARDKVNQKGLKDQAAIYSTQIKKYRELLEKDNRIRKIEAEKARKQKEYEESKRLRKPEVSVSSQETYKQSLQIDNIEQNAEIRNQIEFMANKAEKMAREYESQFKKAIKKGDLIVESKYPNVINIYAKIVDMAKKKGLSEEAAIYNTQIKKYEDLLDKDIKLRELEKEKHKKQLLYEESMKLSPRTDSIKYIALKEKEEEKDEEDIIFNEAMDLINRIENEVKSYELSLKKEILTISSPYEMAIKNYEKARKLLLQIGWKEEALKLNNTIGLYKQKKARDDDLRRKEMEKLKKDTIPSQIAKKVEKDKIFAEEEKRIELGKLKQQKSKEADFVFDLINRAESMAKEYELKKKADILSVKSPYQEIINTYKVAQEKFKEIGWTEQASQLVNTINHYKEKMNADERLRYLENERIRKEQEELEKMKLESKMAKEAEEEIKKQKAQALELKRKQQLEYEAKKEQAFNFMDLAKKELAQNNFDKAINFYQESEKIFAQINWPEGIRMINESIGIIKRKREKFEKEQKYLVERELERKRLESEIKQQITKAQDLKKMQEEQRKQEFLELQKEKDREKEIADQAYKLLEEGTKLKDRKKFEDAYEKYIMGRDLFNKLDWQHEVSRINNDLLFILKKEMKQAEKIKAMQEKKVEEQKELEVLLKEADLKQQELEKIKKEEKRKQREKRIEEEMDNANSVIKDLKYNEAILKLKRVIRKLEKVGNKKLIKQVKNKIKVLENASQIPLIAIEDIEKTEYHDNYRFAFKALDKAQLSLSKNLYMRAISELNETIYNLEETKLGDKYIPILEEKINAYKKELGIEEISKPKEELPEIKEETDNLRAKIAARRAERRKKIRDLMEE